MVAGPKWSGDLWSNLPFWAQEGGRTVDRIPTGTVSFLYTDIEGSTRLWERHPQAMHAALARHDALVQAAVGAHGGYVFQRVGDAFCAAFNTAPAALAAALAAQQALQNEDWGVVGTLKARMAVHTGPAEVRDGDYSGPTVNRSSALLAAGHGGQVLVSATSREMLHDQLPSGVRLYDLGSRRLKDLTLPERVYQLISDDLASDFPNLRTLDSHPNNLPLQPTTFIGREQELAALLGLLRRPDRRLITLSGPGGSGKTRLSLQAAATVLDDYPDGVYFVPLATVSDPALLLPAIAQVLGLAEPNEPESDRLVKAHLRERTILLVLDNFEQLVEAAPQVAELLTVAPHLKIVVSSREVLHLYGEQEYNVPPLALPDPEHLPTLDELAHYPAIALFVTRVQTIKFDFQLTAENAALVATICTRLDGLPLAIELAAARSKLFGLSLLLQQLDNRLRVLTSPLRDLPPRQQSLRGTVEWSYNLLGERERRLFSRLGVFVGGGSSKAIEAICNSSALAPLGLDPFEGLVSLVDKSLLRQTSDGAGEPRFTMLGSIADYAAERLAAGDEAMAVRRCHANYYRSWAEAIEPERTAQQPHLLDQIVQEHGNVRAALAWEVEHAPEDALRLALIVSDFWAAGGYLREGRDLLAHTLAAVGDGWPILRAGAMLKQATLADRMGDYAAARSLREAARGRGLE